jgi:Mg2+ and Co2+ transporter CorA
MKAIARLLSEPVMGFLALAALSVALTPQLFVLPRGFERTLAAVEWTIVALFAAEYLVNFALAHDRMRYVVSPWRLLDAFIILAPLVSLLPFAPAWVRSSPALRVLRLARVILFGARARHGLAGGANGATRFALSGPPRVGALAPGDSAPRPAGWPEVLQWARNPDGRWLHAENLDAARVREIAAVVELPEAMVDAALRETSYPRLESSKRWCALALSLPGSAEQPRTPVLLLVGDRHLLSLSLRAAQLQSAPGLEALPWGARCTLHVIRELLGRNERLADGVEDELRTLEELDPDQSPGRFFETVFRIKRSTVLAKGDLWRLRMLLAMLADGRRHLPGLGEARDALKALSEQADYLHETVERAQEQLLTLLDLHLNIASYDVNRFMRLLAVVSSLALIPTIVGGLLGMNILGNPWPVTLAQVAFGTFILMLGVLYAFMAKGWLR